jgi:predicted DNA binding CopG/RHH family protein
MSQAITKTSTSVRVRFPVEMLNGINDWAAAHDLPRSKAIRTLLYRGLAVSESWTAHCDCDGPDQCSGN